MEHLEPNYRAELAYAVERVGLLQALRRITNERWAPIAILTEELQDTKRTVEKYVRLFETASSERESLLSELAAEQKRNQANAEAITHAVTKQIPDLEGERDDALETVSGLRSQVEEVRDAMRARADELWNAEYENTEKGKQPARSRSQGMTEAADRLSLILSPGSEERS